MPNTLAHIGVQGLASRAWDPRADLQWILLGCVIPDLPWILQRVFRVLPPPGIDPYDLRLYAIAQSSLAGCLLLCGAAALVSAAPRRIFALLGLNSLLHLLLDASQTKLGNGVHLFAPVSWKLSSFDLYWPESPITWLLTAVGAVFLAVAWRKRHRSAIGLGRGRAVTAAGLGLAWAILPWFLLAGPEAADSHSIATLRHRANRPGRVIELDRADYLWRDGRPILRVHREELAIRGQVPEGLEDRTSGNVSVRARFVDPETVVLLEVHVQTFPRDLPSYLGLAAIVLVWLDALRRCRSDKSSRDFTPGS